MSAEPALTDEEVEKLEAVVEFIEAAACIQTGERRMTSDLSGREYVVTRWVELDGEKMVALHKRDLNEADA